MSKYRYIPLIALTLLISACTTSLVTTPVTTATVSKQETLDLMQSTVEEMTEEVETEEAKTQQNTRRGTIVEVDVGAVLDEFYAITGMQLAEGEVAVFGIKYENQQSAVKFTPGERVIWYKDNDAWKKISLDKDDEGDVVGINDGGEVVMRVPGWSKYHFMSSSERTMAVMEFFLTAADGKTQRVIIFIATNLSRELELLSLKPIMAIRRSTEEAETEEAKTHQNTRRGTIVELNIGGVLDEFRSSTGVELVGSEVAVFGIKTGAEESAVIYAPGEMLFWHKFNGIWEQLSLELTSERDVVGINDEGGVVMRMPGWSKYHAMSPEDQRSAMMEWFLITPEGETRRIIVPIISEQMGLKALLLLAPVEIPQPEEINWNDLSKRLYVRADVNGKKEDVPLDWGVIDPNSNHLLDSMGRNSWDGVDYKLITFAATGPAVYDEVNQVVSIPSAFPNVNGEEVRFTLQIYPYSHFGISGGMNVGGLRIIEDIGGMRSITNEGEWISLLVDEFIVSINNKLGDQMAIYVGVDSDGGINNSIEAIASQRREAKIKCEDPNDILYDDCPALLRRSETVSTEMEKNHNNLQSLLLEHDIDGGIVSPWIIHLLLTTD